jgi:hypothetical protein
MKPSSPPSGELGIEDSVQIIEADAITKVDSEGLPLEVSLSKDLRHQNIVQMLDYATRLRKVGMSEVSGPASAHHSRADCVPRRISSWFYILLQGFEHIKVCVPLT